MAEYDNQPWLQIGSALRGFFRLLIAVAATLAGGLSAAAYAARPVVSIVPGFGTDQSSYHSVIAGRPTTLKGVVDEASIGSSWSWDFGDGSGTCTGYVDANPDSPEQTDDPGFTPYWALWCEHAYAASPGDIIAATLTVDNGVDPPVVAPYRIAVRPNVLSEEIGVAIDEALWHMHRNQFRFNGDHTGGPGTIAMGRWDYPQTTGQATLSVTAASVKAFLINGHYEDEPTNPYSDTVSRGLKYLFARLRTEAAVATLQAGENADSNGNGYGIAVNENLASFQNGMVMDAIVSTGARNAISTTGPANVLGRTYSDIVQDMVDYYAWAQNDSGFEIGGWFYNPSNNSAQSADNSIGGWVALGLHSAETLFGATVPLWVKQRNEIALEATDLELAGADGDGITGYQSTSPVWGPFSTTASAMMQMSMDGIQSTSSSTPDERWIRAENLFRRHFDDAIVGNNLKNSYFAMLLLANALRSATPGPVSVIGNNDSIGCGPAAGCAGGVAPIDWYRHPTSGIARVAIDHQVVTGVNIGGFSDRPSNSHGSNQDDHNTPWATLLLDSSHLPPPPVPTATARPNPAAVGTPITFEAGGSFHVNPAATIVLYQWDFNEDGVVDASGETVVRSFECTNLPCVYPVSLIVTDDSIPPQIAQSVVEVSITAPPHPPTAHAGGPYQVCEGEDLLLNGSNSFDINEGTSDSTNPPFDAITAWSWELDGNSPFDFNDAAGETVTVSTTVPILGIIGLQVTDNTKAAFPTANQPNLTHRNFTPVEILNCSCFTSIVASGRAEPGFARVNVDWPHIMEANSYDIYRSAVSPNAGFELLKSNHFTTNATFIDKIVDAQAANFWYRVKPNGVQGCDSSPAARADLGKRQVAP